MMSLTSAFTAGGQQHRQLKTVAKLGRRSEDDAEQRRTPLHSHSIHLLY